MSNDLAAAISQAQSICWDESIGYRLGGMALSSADGVDCSGLIGRCLSDAGGFNYPSYHVGTINMKQALIDAGFTIIPVTTVLDTPVDGDIVVMNHLDLTGGHTFFYKENIQAYTDSSADTDTVGLVQYAKVEASSDRGHSGDGDSRKNGTGAYWEVWCHAFSSLYGGYDPTDPNDEIFIARWGGSSGDKDIFFMKRIRDDQFNTDSWANKFIDIGA